MSRQNERGFILLEMVVSIALITMITGILIPMIIQLKIQQKEITQQLDIYHHMYNVIQSVEINDLPSTNPVTIQDVDVVIEIYFADDLMIAEGVWMNARNNTEIATVYFQP